MCDCCENPMKWRVDEDGHLLVPLGDINTPAPVIIGWEAYEENITPYKERANGNPVVVTIKYLQPVPMFFICAYKERRCYGGPEEGGWGYSERELVATVYPVVGLRKFAEASCRRLNRLARENKTAPEFYDWGTSGIVFAVDRFPGEDDTSMDPRPHYC